MSVKAMAYVWETPYKGAQKLMLLAIADRCDDEGTCFPGVDKLAKKCSVERRAAQMMIAQLEELGEIVVMFNTGIETGHGKTNRYYMKAYRTSLGLSTPKSAPRKKKGNGEVMQFPASLEDRGMQFPASQGVQSFASQGVQRIAPNTSVDTTGDTSDILSSAKASDVDVSYTHNSLHISPLEGKETISAEGRPAAAQQEGIAPLTHTATPKAKHASLKGEMGASSKEITEALSPSAAAPLPQTDAPAKKKRSAKQQARDEAMTIAMNALAKAMGLKLAKTDETRASQIAQTLISAGITYAEFDLYVRRIRKFADGKWPVTLESLLTPGRASEYITARDNHRAAQEAGKVKGAFSESASNITPMANYHKPAELIQSSTPSEDVMALFNGKGVS